MAGVRRAGRTTAVSTRVEQIGDRDCRADQEGEGHGNKDALIRIIHPASRLDARHAFLFPPRWKNSQSDNGGVSRHIPTVRCRREGCPVTAV